MLDYCVVHKCACYVFKLSTSASVHSFWVKFTIVRMLQAWGRIQEKLSLVVRNWAKSGDSQNVENCVGAVW